MATMGVLVAWHHAPDPQATQQAVEEVDRIVAQQGVWASDRDMQYERAEDWLNLAFARQGDPQATQQATRNGSNAYVLNSHGKTRSGRWQMGSSPIALPHQL